jgi:phage tail-like protein
VINAAPFRSAPPGPPHDPMAWRLDARAGWRAAALDRVFAQPVARALALAPAAGSARTLAEPSGSFGGLRPPANVAIGADGGIYLLDRAAAQLKRFDPCECRFEVVPCFGGAGRGRRQLDGATAIAISRGRLYVCDGGNRRVVVVALHGFVVLETWRTPRAAGLAAPWQPRAIAIDPAGRVYVADAANRCILRLDVHGTWQRTWTGLGDALHLATGCDGRVLAVIGADPPRVVALEDDGGFSTVPLHADAARDRFAPAPFPVGPGGALYLTDLCVPGPDAGGAGVFDASGAPLVPAPTYPGPAYEKTGTFRSGALDSGIYRCQWHRVVIEGELPRGTSVEVATFCAEVAMSDGEIAALPDGAWQRAATATALENGSWDALVRSAPGRYLWLRLALGGPGDATPRIDAIEVEFPRVTLRRHLPAVFGAEPTSADFTDRFLAIFDRTLRSVERELDTQARLFDPLSAPADRAKGIDFLTWLGTWIGVAVDRQLPEAKRRLLLKRAASLYDLRGTPYGLWQQLLLFLGIDAAGYGSAAPAAERHCVPRPRNCGPEPPPPRRRAPPPLLLEHFRLRRWLFLGAGRLGDAAVLWGASIVNRTQIDVNGRVGATQLVGTPDPLRDPFHVHAHRFTVFVPGSVGRSDTLRRALENLLRAESPAHTAWEIRYVEPRFRIGVQSMLGLDSAIGRVPRGGVTLGTTPLGPAAVLGQAPGARGVPSFEVGSGARIGGRTRLG